MEYLRPLWTSFDSNLTSLFAIILHKISVKQMILPGCNYRPNVHHNATLMTNYGGGWRIVYPLKCETIMRAVNVLSSAVSTFYNIVYVLQRCRVPWNDSAYENVVLLPRKISGFLFSLGTRFSKLVVRCT